MNIKDDRIEATLLTFKMVLDAKGNLWTDIGGLPLKEVKHIFKTYEDAHLVEILIREGLVKLKSIHRCLEDEITSIQHVE